MRRGRADLEVATPKRRAVAGWGVSTFGTFARCEIRAQSVVARDEVAVGVGTHGRGSRARNEAAPLWTIARAQAAATQVRCRAGRPIGRLSMS